MTFEEIVGMVKRSADRYFFNRDVSCSEIIKAATQIYIAERVIEEKKAEKNGN